VKLFVMTLEPQGALGTPLKGDTLFGHFCWQAQYDPDLINDGLESRLRSYAEAPFAVFSSAFPWLEGAPPPLTL
jgi:CRISPR-associated protein Csm4